MDQQVISKIIKSKIGIFTLQAAILSIFIFGFNYSFPIAFDSGITYERAMIIQLLGNYILVATPSDALFLYGVWTLAAIIPIILLRDARRAFGANLKLCFFPNFFFYLFLSRFSPSYFNSTWLVLFVPFLLFAIPILVLSVMVPKVYHKLKLGDSEAKSHQIRKIAEENRTICPNCGAEFESVPIFCYKCSTRLIPQEKESEKEES